MNKAYIYALLPVWLVAFAIGIYFALGDGSITPTKNILNILLYTLLPLVAGYQIVKIKNSLRLAIAGAMSISLVMIVASSAVYLIQAAPYLAYLGLFFSIVVFQAIPQAAFGALSGLLFRKLNLTHHSSGIPSGAP